MGLPGAPPQDPSPPGGPKGTTLSETTLKEHPGERMFQKSRPLRQGMQPEEPVPAKVSTRSPLSLENKTPAPREELCEQALGSGGPRGHISEKPLTCDFSIRSISGSRGLETPNAIPGLSR